MTEGGPQKTGDLGTDADDQRVIYAYKVVSVAGFTIGVFWTGLFAWLHLWPLAFAEVLFALLGLTGWMLTRAGRLTGAILVCEFGFLAFAVGFCATFDIPTEVSPRVSHLYLPSLAILGYINYMRQRSRVHLVFVVACLATFVAFSSAHLALPFASPIPEEMRGIGTWINATVATLLCCGSIYVMQREFARQQGMVQDLRTALRNQELELFYQPQVGADGKLLGAEALLRWKHPEHGTISPAAFIPVAEEAGLMPELGSWVLKNACRTLASWRDEPSLASLTLAINVSASQFMLDGFERTVLDAISENRIDARKLKLELTESVVISGLEPIIGKMTALRAAGVGFALDDFGTGYSSLSYLRRLPLDQLKVDRSFVQECLDEGRGASLIRSIIQIGLDLDLRVLAEGVENDQQFAFLREAGCAEFQGYLFGRPVPLAIFERQARAYAVAAEAG